MELSPRQAAAQAVQAMGSPEELGRSLDAIHNPLLGRLQLWFLRAARVAGVLMLLYILSQAGAIAANLLAAPKYTGNVGLGGVLEHADPERILADFQPEGRWQWEGYTFSVSRALILSGNQGESKGLYYQLKVTHPNPWLRGPEFRMWLWAEDELGNRYPSRG